MPILENLPDENRIEADIIRVLADLGGKAARAKVVDALVNQWHLTPRELSYRTPGGYVYYEHRIDGAVSKLRGEGKISSPERGIWALAGDIKILLETLVELAKKGKEKEPLPSHDELVGRVKEMGELLGKTAEVKSGPIYKHDCVWKDNPYANPKIVIEACDKGNLDKDIASLLFAVTNWGAKGILVVFEESDFQAAQRKLPRGSQIYPLKAADMLTLHSLAKGGNIPAIRSIFGV